MKKFLLTSLLTLTTIATSFCCWFTTDNFNRNYIYGVNNLVLHYFDNVNITNVTFQNYSANTPTQCVVDLPLTVWVKIQPRIIENMGTESFITKAVLQYKTKNVGPDATWTNWKTVKTIENVSWSLNFANPVALFGRNNINPSGLKAGALIMIRLYLETEEGIKTGNMNDDIDDTQILGTFTDQNAGNNLGYFIRNNTKIYRGWPAPFVMLMKYSGKKRPIR